MTGDAPGAAERGRDTRVRHGRETVTDGIRQAVVGARADAGAPADADAVGGPALCLDGVSLPFGPDVPEGLRDLSLEVAPGERLVLVGASGVGKSSLLRALAGLHPLTAGRVEIGGRTVDAPGMAPVPPEARGAIYLHQVPLLFPHLSVLENVAFPLRVRGVGRGEREARARDLLAAVRLEAHATRSPGALSGGERHRVALARAVAARPPLLLLDEPLSSLDPSLRHEVRAAIVALQEASGAGLLLVTHDLDEAGALGHRIGILVPGRLAQLDPPSQLFDHPASPQVSRFLGYRNEVVVRWDPEVGGWHHPALGLVSVGVTRTDAMAGPTGTLPGGTRAVAVFPPGALRAVSHSPGGAGSRGASGGEGMDRGGDRGVGWGQVVGVRHPGPRPLVLVEMLASERGERGRERPAGSPPPGLPAPPEGTPPLVLEADAEPAHLPTTGDTVALRWDRGRVRVFPEGEAGHLDSTG